MADMPQSISAQLRTAIGDVRESRGDYLVSLEDIAEMVEAIEGDWNQIAALVLPDTRPPVQAVEALLNRVDLDVTVATGEGPLETVLAFLQEVHRENSHALPGTWWPVEALRKARADLAEERRGLIDALAGASAEWSYGEDPPNAVPVVTIAAHVGEETGTTVEQFEGMVARRLADLRAEED